MHCVTIYWPGEATETVYMATDDWTRHKNPIKHKPARHQCSAHCRDE